MYQEIYLGTLSGRRQINAKLRINNAEILDKRQNIKLICFIRAETIGFLKNAGIVFYTFCSEWTKIIFGLAKWRIWEVNYAILKWDE